MRKNVLHAILVTCALALTLGAASAAPVGGQSITYSLDGHEVGAAEAREAAGREVGADAGARTEDVDLSAKAPVCDVNLESRPSVKGCEGPDVQADTGAPTFNVDVFVGFGRIEDAPTDAPAYVALQASAMRAVEHVPPALVLAAAATSAGAVLAYVASRILKYGGIAAIVPLYSQISDDRILDDPNRAGIMRLVREKPGISTKELAEHLGLAWGTVTHHLTKLERRRFIVSKKYGKYRRYFVNGAAPPKDDVGELLGGPARDDELDAGFTLAGRTTPTGASWKDALAILRVEKTAGVARFIRENPGFTQKDVSEALGVSSSTILWHVKRLERVGLVSKIRDGKTVRYFPATALDAPAGDAVGATIAPA